MTTNQTLFRQLVDTGALDERLRVFKTEGRPPKEIYSILYNEAATQAAEAFSAIHARWPWEGRVSQEASALLTELDPLVKDVQRIAGAMAGVGAFTKIPNLAIGPKAIEKAVSGEVPKGDTLRGKGVPFEAVPVVHPNVTLVFSDRHYVKTVEGYLLGLKARVNVLKNQGVSAEAIHQDISRITSVNSLFVSRVDRVADPMIEEQMKKAAAQRDRLALLKGKVAVAQAKKIYQMFEAIFLGVPFEDPLGLYADGEGKGLVGTLARLRELYAELKKLGAKPQRLLIASSGVKSEQPYSPLLYALPFLGPWSANTLPETTLEALSRFVAGLTDEEATYLKRRNLMREPLPAIPTDSGKSSPTADKGGFRADNAWDQAILTTSNERRAQGIGEVTADQILRDVHEIVFKSQGTSLRQICDTLRDKGAAAFTADEQATLAAIQTKLQAL